MKVTNRDMVIFELTELDYMYHEAVETLKVFETYYKKNKNRLNAVQMAQAICELDMERRDNEKV